MQRPEKLVLIENEFGEIGIDGGFLKEAGIQITEMNSGCICCSSGGRFRQGAAKGHGAVPSRPHPHRALRRRQAQSDVDPAPCERAETDDVEIWLHGFATVADAYQVPRSI